VSVRSGDENLPRHTTLATVMASIRQLLPPDAQIGPVQVDGNGGSCGLIAVSAPSLGTPGALGHPKIGDPAGTIEIELSKLNNDTDQTEYNPTDIQTVGWGPTAINLADNC
jgi:hypothetical protein